MTMGGHSRPRGRGFKSQHQILDGIFPTNIVLKIVMFCLKRPKINKKGLGWSTLKNNLEVLSGFFR